MTEQLTSPSTELVNDLVYHYIYRLENPDWGQLQVALYDYGFSSGQVYQILQNVRDEGCAP